MLEIGELLKLRKILVNAASIISAGGALKRPYTIRVNDAPYHLSAASPDDQIAILQQAHDDVLALMIANGKNVPNYSLEIDPGIYKAVSGFQHYPGIPIITNGTVIFQWADEDVPFGAGFSAWTQNPNLWTLNDSTSSPFINAATRGRAINGENGALIIAGPKNADTTSIGFKFGSSVATPDYKDFRHIHNYNLYVDGWGYDVFGLRYSAYLYSFEKCYFGNAGVAHLTYDPSGAPVNSGENCLFDNCTFASGGLATTAFLLQTPAINVTFRDCSSDYTLDSFMRIVQGASTPGYQKITIDSHWFESCFGTACIDSQLAAMPTDLTVNISNPKFVLTRDYGSGYAGPNLPLFKGYFTLALRSPDFGGYKYRSMNADNGMWMCDSKVDMRVAEGITFADWHQLLSKSCVRNRNFDFSQGAVGGQIRLSTVPSWFAKYITGITESVSSDRGWGGASQSMKLVATSSGAYFDIFSDFVPVSGLDDVRAGVVLYGGTSTGLLTVLLNLDFYRFKQIPPTAIGSLTTQGSTAIVATQAPHGLVANSSVMTMWGAKNNNLNIRNLVTRITDTTKTPANIVSMTRSGDTVTVVTATPHGLSQYDTILIAGADQSGYNGYQSVNYTTNSTTFAFRIQTTPATPATGTPSYTMADGFTYTFNGSGVSTDPGILNYVVDSFEYVESGPQHTGTFSDIYTQTGDPDYNAGARTSWAKFHNDARKIVTSQGVTHCRLRFQLKDFANGDTVYIGALPIHVTR